METRSHLVRGVFEKLLRKQSHKKLPQVVISLFSKKTLFLLQKAVPSANWKELLTKYNVEELVSFLYEESPCKKEGIQFCVSEFFIHWFRVAILEWAADIIWFRLSDQELNEIAEGIILFCLLNQVEILNDVYLVAYHNSSSESKLS
jgi:hypothetical protein